ncbi:MAG: hypothetical protein COY40_05820, partial [Alphaproteobacteria bacterium CG_4_10_14_0_8_um_filter_53_9]
KVSFVNVLVRAQMPAGEVAVFSLPHVMMENAFFDKGEHIRMILPDSFSLQILRDQKDVAAYRFEVTNADVSLLGRALNVGASSARIFEADKEIFAFKDGRVRYEPLADGAINLLVQAEDFEMLDTDLQGFSARATFMHMRDAGPALWAMLRLHTEESFQAFVGKIVDLMQKGGELDMDMVSALGSDWKLDISGKISVLENGVPYGELMFKSPRADTTAQAVEESGFIKPSRTEEVYRYDQVMQKFAEGETSAKLILHQGVAILNSFRVGIVPPAKDIVESWF